MTKTTLRSIMACIDYAIQQDETSSGDVFVLSLKDQAAELKTLKEAVAKEYYNKSWVKDFVDDHMQMLLDLQSFAAIRDQEYISNIFELKDTRDINDHDMYYILSRLVLAKQNCDDDLVDCITWLDMMIVDFSTSMASVLDIPEVSTQTMIADGTKMVNDMLDDMFSKTSLTDDFYNEYITIEFNGQRTYIENTASTFDKLVKLLEAAE